jgi:DNA-binding transcriptional LysR family regulator
MPRSYTASFTRLLPLTSQPLPIKLKPIPILAYWHQSKNDDRAHAWFRRLVIETIAQAPAFHAPASD